MKRLLFIGALSGVGAKEAHSQTIAAITEQLVELNIFKRDMVAGYQFMSSGLDSIGTINEREYLLHVNYFHSLDVLDENLDVDPEKIKRLNSLVKQIKELLYDEAPADARPSRRLALAQ